MPSVTAKGTARQLVAILTHGNRAPALSSIQLPTLVIHGTSDPLVSVEGARTQPKQYRGLN